MSWSDPMEAEREGERRLVTAGRCPACGRVLFQISAVDGIAARSDDVPGAAQLATEFCRALDKHGAAWILFGVRADGRRTFGAVPDTVSGASEALRILLGTYLPTKILEYDLQCVAACWTGVGDIDGEVVPTIFVVAADVKDVAWRVARTDGVSWPARPTEPWEEAEITTEANLVPVQHALRRVVHRRK